MPGKEDRQETRWVSERESLHAEAERHDREGQIGQKGREVRKRARQEKR